MKLKKIIKKKKLRFSQGYQKALGTFEVENLIVLPENKLNDVLFTLQ